MKNKGKISNGVYFLKAIELFIKQHGQFVKIPKGQRIFQMDERPTHVYYLTEGWVKIGQETENGQDITLSIRKAGELYGLAEVLANDAARMRYAMSLTEVTCYMMTTEQLHTLLTKQPILWKPLSEMIATRLIETQNFMCALTNLQVPERLAWFLQQFSTFKEGHTIVELPMTHEELSNLVGCSRQKVTSNLNAWRKANLISYERGKIEILDQQLFA